MRVGLLCAWDMRYRGIAQITGPAMLQYAQKHGYGFHVGTYHEDPSDLANYGDRGKIGLYLKHYDAHDILVWLDVDVLIANPEVRVEDVLWELPFLWTYDHNGPCSGFWIAKCIPSVALMFNKVRNDAQLSTSSIARPLDNPKRMAVEFEPYGTSDQTMMRALMNIPPFSEVLAGCVPCKSAGHCFDNRAMKVPEMYDYLANYEPGDWLYTVPSLPIEERMALLRMKARHIYGPDYPGLSPDGDAAAAQLAAPDVNL